MVQISKSLDKIWVVRAKMDGRISCSAAVHYKKPNMGVWGCYQALIFPTVRGCPGQSLPDLVKGKSFTLELGDSQEMDGLSRQN